MQAQFVSRFAGFKFSWGINILAAYSASEAKLLMMEPFMKRIDEFRECILLNSVDLIIIKHFKLYPEK